MPISGHKEGDRICLRELQGLAKNTEDWRNIPKEELTAMIDCVEHARLQKNIGSCSHTASRAHDIKNTIKHVQEEVSAIVSIKPYYSRYFFLSSFVNWIYAVRQHQFASLFAQQPSIPIPHISI